VNPGTTVFSNMTGPQLVAAYNKMVDELAEKFGAQAANAVMKTDAHHANAVMQNATYQQVTRFSGIAAGRARCEKLHALLCERPAQPAARSRGILIQ
jgi:hypothetical protein